MGFATAPKDSRGQDKVQCLVCHGWYHRVDSHAVKAHKLTVAQYKEKFPGAPLMSLAARNELVGELSVEDEDGVIKLGDIQMAKRVGLDEEDQKLVPAADPGIIPDVGALSQLATALVADENVLIVGPPGVGKSTLPRHLASLIGQPYLRVPFNGEVSVSQLMGKPSLKVRKDKTVTGFTRGPVAVGAVRGWWIQGDEVDSVNPSVSFVMHPLLESPRYLANPDEGSEEKTLAVNEKFRFIGTANTLGYGDETGLFQGTGPMNEAFLDRFQTVIRMDYPERGVELDWINKRVRLDSTIAGKMLDVAREVRKAYSEQKILTSLSPRRVLYWARKTAMLGGNVKLAAVYTVTNKLPPSDEKFVAGLIQRIFG